MDRDHWKFEIERAFDPQDQGTWFTSHLLRLIRKADAINRERLRTAFPDAVKAYELWEQGQL